MNKPIIKTEHYTSDIEREFLFFNFIKLITLTKNLNLKKYYFQKNINILKEQIFLEEFYLPSTLKMLPQHMKYS
jgi:hypothetical protein